MTQDIADDWDPLLHALTDEELEQYGRLASDQLRREDRWKLVQIGLVVAAVAIAAWTLGSSFTSGFDRSQLYALGVSWLMGYWPYRTQKSRRLWQYHYDTVLGEKARRGLATV